LAAKPEIGDEDTAARVAELAGLTYVQYERKRKDAAAALGLRPAVLDALVKAARKANGGDRGQGEPISYPEIEPWPDPVDAAALLSEIAAALRRYVVMTAHQTHAVAAWAALTHAIEALDIFLRLILTSPAKRCGKTRLIEALTRLVRKPEQLLEITPAALIRLVAQHQPTVLLDEFDKTAAKSAETTADLMAILNGGFQRGAAVIKCVAVGDLQEPRRFSSFTALGCAGIDLSRLPDTTLDRSMVIRLERKLGQQKTSRLRRRDGADLDELARKAARLMRDCGERIAAADPRMPEALNDRAAEAWQPVVALGELAGGEWPEAMRAAAVALAGETETDDAAGGDVSLMLLAELKRSFDERGDKAISSDEFVADLKQRDERPWGTFNRGKEISKYQVARKLRCYVRSKDVRLPEGIKKGYERDACEDAFARYLPDSSFQTRNTLQAAENKAKLRSELKNDENNSLRDSASNSAACSELRVENEEDGVIEL
jgi:putative DNA primase/helicase